jgi:predicted secreted protein
MVIDSHNKDYYPLMAPVSSYSVPGEVKETGGIIKARVGKPFVITLKCRGAYKWFLDFDYHMVRQDSHEMEGEDIEVFTFTPLKAGKTEVAGVYRQPWGNIVTDTKSFKVEISNDAGIVLTTREAVRLDSRDVAK